MKNKNTKIHQVISFALILSSSFLICTPVKAVDPVTSVIGAITTTMTVKEILDELKIKADAVIGTGIEGGDYLIEKTGRKVGLVVDNLDILLTQQRNKTFGQLDAITQQGLLGLEKTLNSVDGMKGQIMEMEHFLAMDIQNIIHSLPFTSEKYSLRDIQGYSQIFQEKGSYKYSLLGNAFAAENKINIKINNQQVDPIYINNASANKVIFNLPSEIVNESFQDKETSRVNFELSVLKKEETSWLSRLFGADDFEFKEIYDYKTQLLLLPKYPVNYKLKEYYSVSEWSEGSFWSAEGSASVGSTGESADGENPHKHVNACATIPNGTKMVTSTITTRETYGGWGRWDGGPWYSNAGRTVCKRFKHWVHDKGRTVYIKVQYKKPKVESLSRILQVNQLGADMKLENNLSFNVWYETKLGNDYQSFDLIATYFNGKKYTITPSTISNKIEAKLENKTNFKRLLIMTKP